MNELQEYKDLYHDELHMAEYLNSKINSSITFLSLIVTANAMLLNSLFPIQATFISIFYLILCITNIVVAAITIYIFVKAYTGHTYFYFNIESIISNCIQYEQNIIKQLQSQSANIPQKEIFALVNKKKEQWIIEQYLLCSKCNRKTNERKTCRLYNFTVSVIINVIIVFISFIFYVIKNNLIIGGIPNA